MPDRAVVGARELKFVVLPPIDAFAERVAEALRCAHSDLDVVVAHTDAVAAAALPSADAAFGALPQHLLAHASELKWLQSPWSGPPAGFFYPALIEHPVVVTSTRGIFSDHIAVHVMSYVLAFARQLPYYLQNMSVRKWAPAPRAEDSVIHLSESRMTIVGLGGIGVELARIASTFGIHVDAVDTRVRVPPAGVRHVYRFEELSRSVADADFVAVTVPETPVTTGLFNAEFFSCMKRGAIFVNVGRGATVRLDDLAAALVSGRIGGAALDVYEIEPLPPESSLWALPNVILTPHVAWHGPYLDDRRLAILLDNLVAFRRGDILQNVVDKASWY